MSNEKMREEFEAWVLSCWPNQSIARFNALHGVTEGEYTGFTVQHCWDAWKASRAAVEVELPEGGYWAGYENEHMMESRDVRDAIEAAGLKVHP